jgi:hypothetical protein
MSSKVGSPAVPWLQNHLFLKRMTSTFRLSSNVHLAASYSHYMIVLSNTIVRFYGQDFVCLRHSSRHLRGLLITMRCFLVKNYMKKPAKDYEEDHRIPLDAEDYRPCHVSQ